jgi:serine/threonine protein phosphatase PrpC
MERDGSTLVRQYNINSETSADATTGGIFSSSASEMPGQGDIVQKILPLRVCKSDVGSERPDVPSEALMLWSGDGRIGCLSFGTQNPIKPDDSWHDAVEEQGLSAEERAREDAERQYDLRMRRALERNADEVRFVRGLGMASF